MRPLIAAILLLLAPVRPAVDYTDAAVIERVEIGYSGVTVLLYLDRQPTGNRARTRCGWYADVEPMPRGRGVIARNGPATKPVPQPGDTLYFHERSDS